MASLSFYHTQNWFLSLLKGCHKSFFRHLMQKLLRELYGNAKTLQSLPSSTKELLKHYKAKLMCFWNHSESQNFKEQGTLITGWNLTCGHNIALFFSMPAVLSRQWVGCCRPTPHHVKLSQNKSWFDTSKVVLRMHRDCMSHPGWQHVDALCWKILYHSLYKLFHS